MKKMIAFLLCTLCLFSLAACGNKPAEAPPEGSSELVGMANPFVDYDTMEAASAAVGFDFTVPDTIEGFPTRQIQVMNGEMIQVLYLNENGDRVMLRKAAGTEDISGDYNEYNVTAEWDGETASGTLRANGDDFYVASWQSFDGFTYSIAVDQPMSHDAMHALISSVK